GADLSAMGRSATPKIGTALQSIADKSAPTARMKDVSWAKHLLSQLTNSIKETCDTVPQLTESGVCR
ncbi:hypothetical protein ACIKP7_19560, partial [Pseudomonas caricapapayae]